MLRPHLTSILAIPVLALAACSDAKAPAATPTASATVTATTVAMAVATPTSANATSTATATAAAAARSRVSANNATTAQLQAAFEAAGIASASRWAREVDEYRPYPTTDPDLPKLRRELAKYSPAPGVVDAIVATLSLP